MRTIYFRYVFIILLSLAVMSFGVEWQQIGLAGKEVTALDIDMNGPHAMVYIGTAKEGVYEYNETNGTMGPFYTGYLDTFELFIRNVNTIYRKELDFYVGTDSGFCCYFFMDDSSHWGKSISHPVTAIQGNNDTLFAATKWKVYRKTPDSNSWKILNTDSALAGGMFVPCFTSLAVSIHPNTSVYAGSMSQISIEPWSGILMSSNLGDTWTVHNSGLIPPVISVHSLCFYRKNVTDKNGSFACGTNKGVYWHTATMKSWEPLQSGVLDSLKINNLHVTTYSNSDIPEIFACTDSGAYLLSAYPQSSFDDAEWHCLGFDKKTFCSAAIPQTGNYVKYWYVGTEDGLYKCYRDEAAIEKEDDKYETEHISNITDLVRLIRTNSKVYVTLPEVGNIPVSITIVSPNGKTVRFLQHTIHTKGNNAAVWDLNDENGNCIPAGIYLIHITMQGHYIIKPFVYHR